MKLKALLIRHAPFLCLFIAALALRSFRLDELTTFGGDQGQDFLVVRDMIVHHNFTLLGIKTSIGPFFQGPVYLYLLYPFFLLLGLHPIAGPVAAVTMAGVSLTILYRLVDKHFSRPAALYAVLMFSISTEMFMYGNTPLYQHFLPPFILGALYLYISRVNTHRILVMWAGIGLLTGIGMEIHRMNILLVLTFITLIMWLEKDQLKKLGLFLFGCTLGMLPTLAFELRHSFFNTRQFLAHQSEAGPHGEVGALASQFVQGTARFLGGNSEAVGMALLACSAYMIFRPMQAEGPHTERTSWQSIQRFAVISALIGALLSLTFGAFEEHYLLQLWLVLFVLVPVGLVLYVGHRMATLIIALVVLSNVYSLLPVLSANHGINMPPGLTMKILNQAGILIASDAQGREQINVASFLDGNTRNYPLRYTSAVAGAALDQVEEYPTSKHLYVTVYSQGDLKTTGTWEVTSMRPFTIGATWDMGNSVYMVRLDRIQP